MTVKIGKAMSLAHGYSLFYLLRCAVPWPAFTCHKDVLRLDVPVDDLQQELHPLLPQQKHMS